MYSSIRRTTVGALLAVPLALATPQAYAAPVADTAASVRALPDGFVRESPASSCASTGARGVAEGKWTAYLCRQDLPLTPFVYLYVKNRGLQ